MEEDKKDEIHVCHGFSCGNRSAENILDKLKKSFKIKDAKIEPCGCLGNCRNSNSIAVNDKLLDMQTEEGAEKNVDRELSKQRSARSGPMSADQADNILNL